MRFAKRPRPIFSAWPLGFLLAFLAPVLPGGSAAAQQPAAVVQQPIQSDSDLVVLDVSVLDRDGNLLDGLNRKDFRVLDEGTEKPLLFFDAVDAPAHVVILVETGPAVYLIHKQHLVALSTLLRGLSPDDQAALFIYADSPRQVVPSTTNRAALLDSLGEAQYILGMDQLNLFDALGSVVDWLPAGPEKKAIVVLSTGLDSSPASHWDTLERRLSASDVVIFPVALGGPLRGDAPVNSSKKAKRKAPPPEPSSGVAAFARADKALRALAEITGGRAYFPQTPEDFAPAYREIAAMLRHQYLLGIAPDHDGAFHKLSIEVLDGRGRAPKPGAKNPSFRAFYREGYLAPAP